MSESEINNMQFKARIQWAHVHRAKDNSKFNGKPTYQLDVILDTPELVAAMEGLLEANSVSLDVFNPSTEARQSRIKTNKDGIKFLTLKRDEVNSMGKEAKIEVVDSSGTAIPSTVGIGNGTLATINFFSYPIKNKPGQYAIRLSGIQVLELVESKSSSSSFKPIEGGFSINDLNALDEEATLAAHSHTEA